ncbi:MAG: glycosyltransferase family 4 protein, partial [Thermoanaerobaculia bacterium]|nr:glycosyltransferase family 4 protein [Thermoanaerobaculia bacterium]
QATYRTADLVISTNESYREVAKERGRVPAEKIFVVRSGPEATRFRGVPGREEHKRGKRYLVAYLGVMAPQDGVDYLLRAAKHLRDGGRDDVSYTLIGSGDSFEDLQELSRRLGLDDVVRFTGRIGDPEVEDILSSADVCVGPDPKNPLNDVSTMNKILEYMALGKPIVAFDLKETRFSAGDGALYATPNEEADLAAKIAKLLDDADLRREMGEYNRKRFRAGLAWEFNQAELVRAYDLLLGVRRRAGELPAGTPASGGPPAGEAAS